VLKTRTTFLGYAPKCFVMVDDRDLSSCELPSRDRDPAIHWPLRRKRSLRRHLDHSGARSGNHESLLRLLPPTGLKKIGADLTKQTYCAIKRTHIRNIVYCDIRVFAVEANKTSQYLPRPYFYKISNSHIKQSLEYFVETNWTD
jgi:hypothetical protein